MTLVQLIVYLMSDKEAQSRGKALNTYDDILAVARAAGWKGSV